MTGKEFVHILANDESEIIQILLEILSKSGSRYCLVEKYPQLEASLPQSLRDELNK